MHRTHDIHDTSDAATPASFTPPSPQKNLPRRTIRWAAGLAIVLGTLVGCDGTESSDTPDDGEPGAGAVCALDIPVETAPPGVEALTEEETGDTADCFEAERCANPDDVVRFDDTRYATFSGALDRDCHEYATESGATYIGEDDDVIRIAAPPHTRLEIEVVADGAPQFFPAITVHDGARTIAGNRFDQDATTSRLVTVMPTNAEFLEVAIEDAGDLDSGWDDCDAFESDHQGLRPLQYTLSIERAPLELIELGRLDDGMSRVTIDDQIAHTGDAKYYAFQTDEDASFLVSVRGADSPRFSPLITGIVAANGHFYQHFTAVDEVEVDSGPLVSMESARMMTYRTLYGLPAGRQAGPLADERVVAPLFPPECGCDDDPGLCTHVVRITHPSAVGDGAGGYALTVELDATEPWLDPDCPLPLLLGQCEAPPAAVFASDEVRFVTPPIGESSTETLLLWTSGSASTAAIVHDIELRGTGPYIEVALNDVSPFGGSPSRTQPPFALPPEGRMVELPVTFAPESNDYGCADDPSDPDACGAIVLHHNDPDRPPVEVPIRFDLTAGQVSVTPSEVVFEATLDTQIRPVAITNNGTEDLALLDVTLVSSPATLTLGGPQPPPTLAPGESANYTITYRPTGTTEDPGTLRIATSSAFASEVLVPIVVR